MKDVKVHAKDILRMIPDEELAKLSCSTKVREFGIRNIKKVEVVVYSPYVPVMVPAYSRRNNMQQVPSIDSL